jgi:hypothetical protein
MACWACGHANGQPGHQLCNDADECYRRWQGRSAVSAPVETAQSVTEAVASPVAEAHRRHQFDREALAAVESSPPQSDMYGSPTGWLRRWWDRRTA